jgi:starch phosphorylase
VALADLAAMAKDLWWTTDPASERLWAKVTGHAWAASGHNPVAALKNTDLDALDPALVEEVEAWLARWPRGGRLEEQPPPTQKRVAYFCMEYGLHESLPIYSGGLGMLAGDHLRSAADLGIDLVAVGLMYRQGYFLQDIIDGRQVARYGAYDPATLPFYPTTGGPWENIRIEIPDGEGTYVATVRVVMVGHVRLFLLDTDLPENPEPIRDLTTRLYGGDTRMRLHQEVLLGFGGVRLLEKLGITRDVFHMNEGHAAFLTTALLEQATALGASTEDARTQVREKCVFTTHTPVPAGHDRFSPDAVAAVLGPTMSRANLSTEDWAAPATTEDGQFCMSTLAIQSSRVINGVSKLHAEVSNEMFAHLGKPIQPITNGVHPTAWLAEATQGLFNAHLPGWRANISDPAFWAKAGSLPTDALMTTRFALRSRLVDAVRAELGDDSLLDKNRLTIGFARRFATYKRANLIFTQPDTLLEILDAGAQIIFAGKAHPRDEPGQDLIAEIIRWSEDPRFKGKIVFVPGYDPRWGRLLTTGADVWLNNPRRPREASGTSGQKAALNGNPNLSVLDGWWPEAADGTNGWSIPGTTDLEDALALYSLLKEAVLPAFRDDEQWAELMRRNFQTCMPVFNTDRMLKDYCSILYGTEQA